MNYETNAVGTVDSWFQQHSFISDLVHTQDSNFIEEPNESLYTTQNEYDAQPSNN